jgi:asparagine synthase (glutamine-hydrolysing)
MCGIAGFVSCRPVAGCEAILRNMATRIAHRGPDDEGFLVSSTPDQQTHVGLAHRRLSIIDLESGHQPQENEDGSVTVIFNGEIYNFQKLRTELEAHGHKFRTRSDTEVIVHAYEQWGTDCATRFRGMFAFALWDERAGRLFLARDRFGKKPLFLYCCEDTLVFGSEIKSILEFPGVSRAVNTSVIADYLQYRYVPGPETLFAGIRKLAPGSYLLWERKRIVERRFAWPPDGAVPDKSCSVADVPAAFLATLDEAVSLRMISDVPFGAFLSGGIDSSAIVGLMCRHSSQRIKTFSVGFAESAYSELAYARTVAERFMTQHHELVVRQEDLVTQLPMLTRLRDAPVAEPSDVPIYMLSCEAAKTVKMVLTGEGSDEILGGYPKHVFERFVPCYQRIPRVLRRQLVEPLTTMLPYGFRRAKTAIATLGVEERTDRYPRWFGALGREEIAALLALPLPQKEEAAEPQFGSAAGNSSLRSILFFDQISWLPDNLLERGDRMTMGASIEARMPFMDHVLAEFISSLPDSWRIHGFRSKWVLRAAMRSVLPPEILQRPKIGFRVPVNEWFRTSMRDFLLDHVRDPNMRTRNYFRRDALTRYVDEHLTGRQNHEKLLWTLLSLELWHREYGFSA